MASSIHSIKLNKVFPSESPLIRSADESHFKKITAVKLRAFFSTINVLHTDWKMMAQTGNF